ncbi:DUF4082 domain-containing protein [Microbacterium sp. NPDC057650]|uniref:DUF4082 domain-containing protein n=1 Tax=unclassified Microbacterium TaxID=2609290 RepID=UPI003672CE7D
MQGTGELRVRTSRTRRVVALIAAFAVVMGAIIAGSASEPAQAVGSSCGPTINPIVCENSKPGTDPSVWDIDGAGDDSIQGFATDISVNAGSKIDFKVDTNARAYTIDIYRTGWYQGKGARFIQSVPVTAALPQTQPQCISDVSTELYDCGTWKVSASWNVPNTAVSGVYVAKLTRTDTGGASHIIFIVRNDGSTSDVVFQTSDPTWQAYNTYGGSDFYQGNANGRSYKISYNRPFATRGSMAGRDFYFSSEYATVRFLERNGYDMTYMAGVDTDRYGAQLLNHKVFLSVGHDEYWSGAQRKNVEAARDAGVNLQFLSGNEIYWRTRYEPSADVSKTPYRTLVSYKETWANAKIDPTSQWTGTWRDPRFAGAGNGGTLPENSLTGTMYFVNDDDLAVTVNSDEGKLRLWRNTSLTSLATGTKAALAPHTIGYESDEDSDNGFRPAGLIRLSTTVGPTPQYLTDYGNVVVPGTTEHHLTMYRAPSGALVFGAGTVQWGWGLDQEHDGNGAAADTRMQQAQVNLLADMGAQPGSLMTGLVAATKSTDTTAPVTSITSPTLGQKIAHGTTRTITGTATDVGGRVAGVEVSVDGGATWHPATGTTNWSYSYVQQGNGATTLLARAADDSGNFSANGTSVSVDVTGPFSVWGTRIPAQPAASDNQAVELGQRFTPTTDGYVNGVRFYKGATNTGTHTGTLWSEAGEQLASVQFTNETATGWQTAQFSAPVSVKAGVGYVVSYTAPKGGYAYDENYWPYKATPSTPLEVTSGVGAASPGVYGNPGDYPTLTYGDANYYVDVTFTAAASSPLAVVARTPVATSTSNMLNSTVTARFSKAVDASTVGLTVKAADGTTAPGTVGYDATTKTVTFTPSAALAAGTKYTAVPQAQDTSGGALAADAAWTFTTQTADLPDGTCPCTLFSESSRPMVDADPDATLVTLGVKVTPASDGKITALKYFKGTRNSGSHTGALWSSTGTKLASVTFADDSVYGWQTAKLSSPVSVKSGQTYVASYTAPQGGYSSSAGQFTAAFTRGPLTVPASGAVYTYADAFPTSTSTTSYLVDVVFEQGTPAPNLVSTTPVTGTVDVTRSTAISATFSAPISATFTGTVKANGTAVAGAWSRSSDGRSAVFAPAAALPASASVTVALTGVTGAQGGDVADTNWSFVVAATNGSPVLTLLGSRVPEIASDPDTAAVELGMAFRTSAPGQVTAIRFYKGTANTGTHTGSLWGPNGELLATVTFANESTSGWQRAALSTPVQLNAGAVYTVSYFAPSGRYSYTSAGFSSPVTNGVLSAETSDNGVYRYGAGSTMPTGTWNSTNYFVDVEFAADATAPTVATATPARSAQNVLVGAAVSAQFDRDVATGSPSITLKTTAGVTVPGTVGYDAGTRTVTFTPAAALQAGTGYRVSVVLNAAEIDSWTFTTAAQAQQGTTGNLFGTAAPATPSTADTDPVEVGTAFRVTEAGSATAIRFYKGTGNTGTHVGTLWSSDGAVLARVTFTSESSNGWQRAQLASPVALDPTKTYVVSYYAPKGHYASASGYFSAERANGKIVGLAPANGLYRYGTGGGFPTSSWNSSAYFVDAEIVFAGAG